jgi:uncharacterized protein (TIGR02271 family)
MSNKELVESNPHVYSLVEKLRSAVSNFTVVDKQGRLLGEVKELILDNNCQLNFVVGQFATAHSPRLFLLLSKLIEKIDHQNKSVFADVNEAEVENFPEYVNIEKSEIELSKTSNSLATPTYEILDEDSTKDSESMVSTSVGLAEIPADNASALQLFDKPEVSEVNIEKSEIELSKTSNSLATPTYEILDEDSTKDDESMVSTLVGLAEIPADNDSVLQLFDKPEVSEGEIVRVIEERLVVDRSKVKLGEVIVRKEIETRMVEVPVQREKLVVEQVSLEGKHLVDIELGQEEISAVELNASEITEDKPSRTVDLGSEITVTGEFSSAKVASLLLKAISLEQHQGCKKVRVKIVTEDAECQKTYQEWFNRVSDSQTR